MDGNEQEVYADSAYAGGEIAATLGNKAHIMHRPYHNKPLKDKQHRENNIIQKTRYLGLARNHAFALLIAIAYNIKRAAAKTKLASSS